MDADWIESPRESYQSRREKRWSMNSQRLEEIVAELMKPISTDNRRSFDTDLSALLEEYLTEAGLHVLDAAENSSTPASHSELVLPNFAEIALLLQQSATIYGRKVDFLYQHVINVSESIQNTTTETSSGSPGDSPQAPNASRRKRKASVPMISDFAEIELETCAAATRETESVRPPPTLPRLYLELEPRVMNTADLPLHDYAGEHIGMLADFQLTWRLADGVLVDELESGGDRGASCGAGGLRPLSLVELQAAVAARAPPSPPRERSHSPPPVPPDTPPPPHTQLSKKQRKRRSDTHIDQLYVDTFKFVFTKNTLRKLRKVEEFCIDEKWIQSVVKKRKSDILNARKLMFQEISPEKGFLGWSMKEAEVAAGAMTSLRAARGDNDSDDDGFFEQSGDDDESLATQRPSEQLADTTVASCTGASSEESGVGGSGENGVGGSGESGVGGSGESGVRGSGESGVGGSETLAEWRAHVARCAEQAAARGAPDVRALAERLLRHTGRAPQHVDSVLRAEAAHQADVSRLVLAALFMANSGNIEIVAGPALTINSCSLRVVSRDTSRLARAHGASEPLS